MVKSAARSIAARVWTCVGQTLREPKQNLKSSNVTIYHDILQRCAPVKSTYLKYVQRLLLSVTRHLWASRPLARPSACTQQAFLCLPVEHHRSTLNQSLILLSNLHTSLKPLWICFGPYTYSRWSQFTRLLESSAAAGSSVAVSHSVHPANCSMEGHTRPSPNFSAQTHLNGSPL